MLYDLDKANDKREALGKERLTLEEADDVIRQSQDKSKLVRDGDKFMQWVIESS